jgi:hypothetical protein
MTMLTHIHPNERLGRPSVGPAHARSRGAAHLGATKRFFTGVISILVATAAVAGVIAMKSAFYLSHFSH